MRDTAVFVTLEQLNECQEPIIGFNPTADANETRPLLATGDYNVRVTFLESDFANR